MKHTFPSIFFIVSFVIFTFYNAGAQIPTNPIFWLRADSGVVLSSNNIVTEWKDQSGTTKSAFQSLPVSQPTLLSKVFNNFPAIHFDGRFDYMDCAPIFPIMNDYSISIVARVIDFTRQNNFISGNTHTIYLGGASFPIVRNDTVPAPNVISNIPLIANQPAIITVTYRQSTQTASIYINGEFADSAVIGSNKDPKIFLGAFQGIASFYGDIAEIILYSRMLTETDRKQLEDYLFTKYAIPPTPAPDSIYASVPRRLQFYQREDDDSATVTIGGNLYESGYDSIYVKTFKNGTLINRTSQPLIYESGKAPFTFSPRIHAELVEYSFSLSEKNTTVDKQIGFRDSIVCGDALLINGQSNAIANNLGYTNEFFRTFGNNQETSPADSNWAISSTETSFGFGPDAGSFGLRIQEDIMNSYHLPTCIINGGAQTTDILEHLPDTLNHYNISTFYGNMLYRAVKAGLAKKVKVLFWYQGESDSLLGYAAKFRTLYNAWKDDYPNIQKIYLMQVRPGCTLGFNEDLRDLQRTLQDSFPNLESVSTMGLPGHDGCHFDSAGYKQLGDQLFRLLSRDFYASLDNSQISSPNILQAYYTNSSHMRIGLTFTPDDTRFVIPNDTIIGGIPASIKDYFYLNDTGEVVQSVSTARNRIFLDLNMPSTARLLNYLPDKYYNHTSTVFEGPWLENERGIGAFSFYHVPIVDSAQAGINSTLINLPMTAYPNPCNGKFILCYSTLSNENITLELFDALGRKSFSITKFCEKGEHRDLYDANFLHLDDGIYICRIQSRESSAVVSVAVRK